MMRSTGARATGNLYDGDGNRIRVIHPDNSFFTYDLDGFGRPIRIREGVGELLARFSYDSAGRPATRTWPTTTTWVYDPAGRLQSLSHDLEGTSRDQTETFTYNNALQIVGRTTTNDAYAWSDSNTYVRSYAANGQNQYTATLIDNTPGSTFAYDLNGNLENDGLTAFVYDSAGRYAEATPPKSLASKQCSGYVLNGSLTCGFQAAAVPIFRFPL
jgi:YD repeat-containing protein